MGISNYIPPKYVHIERKNPLHIGKMYYQDYGTKEYVYFTQLDGNITNIKEFMFTPKTVPNAQPQAKIEVEITDPKTGERFLLTIGRYTVYAANICNSLMSLHLKGVKPPYCNINIRAMKTQKNGEDFLYPYITINGERLVWAIELIDRPPIIEEEYITKAGKKEIIKDSTGRDQWTDENIIDPLIEAFKEIAWAHTYNKPANEEEDEVPF